MEDLDKAKALLASCGCTCVICKGDTVYQSTQRGVAPLLAWLDVGTDMMGFSAADKVVGKGAAMLYCLLGVRRVYGKVMSVAAVKIFKANGIEPSWDGLTDGVLNRKQTGPCPIESACQGIDEPEQALPLIRKTLEKLSQM